MLFEFDSVEDVERGAAILYCFEEREDHRLMFCRQVLEKEQLRGVKLYRVILFYTFLVRDLNAIGSWHRIYKWPYELLAIEPPCADELLTNNSKLNN